MEAICNSTSMGNQCDVRGYKSNGSRCLSCGQKFDERHCILKNSNKAFDHVFHQPWTMEDDETMIYLLNKGLSIQDVAAELGYSLTTTIDKAAELAAEELLTALSLSANKSFSESAPSLIADISKKWKIDGIDLRFAFKKMSAHRIMLELKLIPESTPEMNNGMPSGELLVRLGIFKPWLAPDISEVPKEMEIKESLKGGTITESLLQEQLKKLETRIQTKFEERFNRLETLIEGDIQKRSMRPYPLPVIINQLENLEDAMNKRMDIINTRVSHILDIFNS